MKFYDVVIENKSKYTDSAFTYKGEDGISVGALVKVPFGTYNSQKQGIVIDIKEEADFDEKKLKEISEVISNEHLFPEMIKTALWMKTRYGIKYYDALNCFVQSGKPAKEGKNKEPYKDIKVSYEKPEHLTSEQRFAVERISKSLDERKQDSFLIHGVTSSGKTEVYMAAIEKAIEKDRGAIMLVPEISLTKQVVETFVGRFGKDKIAVLHSKLTKRERFDEWERIKTGKAKIVVGARMAVFAPLKDIGLIVMDEEHDSSYKADMTPKYDTVDVAMKRLVTHKGVLILGSATPSVISYSRVNEGILELIELKERYNKTPLPDVEIVDMREELKAGNSSIFSNRLFSLMKENLESNKQVILLQNRRGYSNFVSCRECGYVAKCPDCGISLTYHKGQEKLICHYCGKKFDAPKVCPECNSKYIKYFGIGTEKVVEKAQELFSDKVTERLDIDAIKNRKDLDIILENFKENKTQILVGTQLVAKGLDFSNVGLVGIIAADTGLNIPDFRSPERTYQLVTQASGRAGRGKERGKVVIQTYEPDNYALVKASENDYQGFFEEEIYRRKLMNYPPFTDLIMVNFTSENETDAINEGNSCKAYIEKNKKGKSVILAPRFSSKFKGNNAVRYFILIKSEKGERNEYIYLLEEYKKQLTSSEIDVNMDIDVNPYSSY